MVDEIRNVNPSTGAAPIRCESNEIDFKYLTHPFDRDVKSVRIHVRAQGTHVIYCDFILRSFPTAEG